MAGTLCDYLPQQAYISHKIWSCPQKTTLIIFCQFFTGANNFGTKN